MSLNPGSNKITPSLELLRFPMASLTTKRTQCPHCPSFLTIVQPDTDLPDRLIGACEECKHWYLIDTAFSMNEGIMLRLPDGQVIRSLSRQNPLDGISLTDSEPA